ncbi:MAG: helix-turn-helix domain-containing protein [Thermaerobacter sp.]|nr:helix-turn-helix domain-containing protein [Thermaerobacter sp.]
MFSESFQNWAILTGAVGLQDLTRCVGVVAQSAGAPARLFWPAPFGLPETADSDQYDPDWAHATAHFRVPSAIFPEVSPELWVQFPPRAGTPDMPEDILGALAERWRKTLAESTQAIDRVWNQMWLAVHAGISEPGDLYPLIATGAEAIVRSPVVLLAMRHAGRQTLEIVHTQGLRDPGFSFRLPLSRGIGGFVVDTQESVVVADYQSSHWQDPLMEKLLRQEEIAGGMVVPFQAWEQMDGALYALFNRPGAPSPLALLALQRYVRSIRAVLFSAQNASPYPYATSLARVADNPAATHILRKLRVARRQSAWQPLVTALGDYAIGLQVVDAWGQTLESSAEVGETPPDRTTPLDGLEPGLLSLWSRQLELIDAIHPHLVQTATLLLNAETRRLDKLMHTGHHWLRQVSARGTEDQTNAWAQRKAIGLSDEIVQVWCLDLLPSTSGPAIGPVHALFRHVKARTGATPIFDRGKVWVFSAKPLAPDAMEDLRQDIAQRLGHPVYCAGLHSTLDPSTIEPVLVRLDNALMAWARRHPEGGTHFLNRPALNDLLSLAEVKAPVHLFAESWIGPLGHYDLLHQTSLVATLEIYLTAGSLTQAARRLFVHPNTVRYRLEQIVSLVPGIALDDPEMRLALAVAARGWNLCH